MIDLDLTNAGCIVTGGGSGIGRSIALELADHGATIAVTGRREELCAETAAMVRERGGQAWHRAMDVTRLADVDLGMQALAETMGVIDILVNNAGVGGPNACSGDGPDRWDPVVRTNLDGIFRCSRAALRYMPIGSRIINISSVLGQFGVPDHTAYCASKHGVIGFTKALALELAPRQITVNAICPGWVETQMARDGMATMATAMGTGYEEARRAALAAVPLGRILEPAEIAGMAVYLASPSASGITAQAISICGGQVMNG